MKQNVYDNRKFFEGYKDLRESGFGLNDALEQPAIRSLLPSLSGLDVLDLGCGMGQFAAACADHGVHLVVGVDLSQKMLEYAQAHYGDERIKYIHSAVEDVRFPDESFDLVVSSFVLHYVADYATLVNHVYRWLRPGGQFIYSCEHPIITAQTPSCGQWIRDTEGRKLHWSVDSYGDESQREQTWFIEGVVKYHRKLSTLVNGLVECGFRVEKLLEPEATEEAIAARPNLTAERRRPPVLVVSVTKPEFT